jgi:hypothetical protein
MSASGMLQPNSQVVTFSIAATGAATVTSINGSTPASGASFALKYAEGYTAELLVTTSAGTVDVALQHSTDGGTTFRTLPLKFAQSASASATASSLLIFKPAIGLSDAATAVTPALTGTAVATNLPFNYKVLRAFATLGTAGATVFSIIFTVTPKGNVIQ